MTKLTRHSAIVTVERVALTDADGATQDQTYSVRVRTADGLDETLICGPLTSIAEVWGRVLAMNAEPVEKEDAR